jgi:thiol-disulfide isomerase/thioredoxin
MRRSGKEVIVIALGIVVVSVIVGSLSITRAAMAVPVGPQPPQEQQQVIGIAVGAKAPDAILETLDGKRVALSSYLGKGPVLIEFWATWCKYCQELEPTLLQAAKDYEGKVTFVGVAVSVNQSPARVQSYVAQHHMSHVILFDAKGNATEAYDVPATSYVVVVNKAGTVVYTGVGGEQDLHAAIKKAL